MAIQTLKGRTCVFAGATAGDGPAAALRLAEGGMNVAILTHQLEAALQLQQEMDIRGLGKRCMIIAGGEDGEKPRAEAYHEIAEYFGSIDVVLCNMGGDGRQDDLDTLRMEHLERYISHLVCGSFEMLQAGLPYLRKSAAARVIFMTTPEGCNGGSHESFAHSVAKGAVRSLALNAAFRLASEGITVNCISKGVIPRMENLPKDGIDCARRLSVIPMGRLGTQEDLAGVVCFLASEESSYITGQILELNGGMNLGR